MNGSANLRSTDHETEATVYITNWQESWDLNSDHILSEKDSKGHLCIQITEYYVYNGTSNIC